MEHMPPLFYFVLGCMVGASCVVLLWQAWVGSDRWFGGK